MAGTRQRGNRHFIVHEYGDVSFFKSCFELNNNFLFVKYSPILSAEYGTIVGNKNFAIKYSLI